MVKNPEKQNSEPLVIEKRNKTYYLCLDTHQRIYYFTTRISNLPIGHHHVSLPPGYIVSQKNSYYPVLVKKHE